MLEIVRLALLSDITVLAVRFASTARPTSIIVCLPSVSRSNTSILSGADSFCCTNMRSTASLVSGKSAPDGNVSKAFR